MRILGLVRAAALALLSLSGAAADAAVTYKISYIGTVFSSYAYEDYDDYGVPTRIDVAAPYHTGESVRLDFDYSFLFNYSYRDLVESGAIDLRNNGFSLFANPNDGDTIVHGEGYNLADDNYEQGYGIVSDYFDYSSNNLGCYDENSGVGSLCYREAKIFNPTIAMGFANSFDYATSNLPECGLGCEPINGISKAAMF